MLEASLVGKHQMAHPYLKEHILCIESCVEHDHHCLHVKQTLVLLHDLFLGFLKLISLDFQQSLDRPFVATT
jgi:hypothetical protein